MSAIDEFNKSSKYNPPAGYEPWKIRNDYPTDSGEKPAWLDIDFTQDPKAYSEAVKKYILEGNVKHNFVVQKNTLRDWYHPPWLHYGDHGREPINGLKYAADIPAKFISENQNRILQCWLCSYFNAPAATVLGRFWADPNEPKWDKDHPVKFPVGSIIFENAFCDVSEDQVYTLKGAPTADACIGIVDSSGKSHPEIRKDTPDTLRLIQTEFAARDDRFPELGWVFGVFIYDGTKANHNHPWDNLVPVGIQWGNDPTLTQKAHDDGKLSKECWIDGYALDLFKSLKGDRPWLGFHGRLDGLLDDFMSTCTSCHATAQLTPAGKPVTSRVQDPLPKKIPAGAGPGIWVQEDEKAIDRWFRNVPAGEPFDEGYLSADYNRHVQFAYENYLDWKEKHSHQHA
jgi:hypothetical protein